MNLARKWLSHPVILSGSHANNSISVWVTIFTAICQWATKSIGWLWVRGFTSSSCQEENNHADRVGHLRRIGAWQRQQQHSQFNRHNNNSNWLAWCWNNWFLFLLLNCKLGVRLTGVLLRLWLLNCVLVVQVTLPWSYRLASSPASSLNHNNNRYGYTTSAIDAPNDGAPRWMGWMLSWPEMNGITVVVGWAAKVQASSPLPRASNSPGKGSIQWANYTEVALSWL